MEEGHVKEGGVERAEAQQSRRGLERQHPTRAPVREQHPAGIPCEVRSHEEAGTQPPQPTARHQPVHEPSSEAQAPEFLLGDEMEQFQLNPERPQAVLAVASPHVHAPLALDCMGGRCPRETPYRRGPTRAVAIPLKRGGRG
jgi:hypothetical protein